MASVKGSSTITSLWNETKKKNSGGSSGSTYNSAALNTTPIKITGSKGTGSTGGGSGAGGTGSTGTYKMSADTYNRYETDYANWKKTGQHTADYSVWSNDNDLNAWKSIKNGKYRVAQVGGDIYYLDNNQYKQYGKDYDVWAKTGAHSSDYSTWGSDAGATAFKYIRDDENGYGNLNNFKASVDEDLLNAVAEKYRSQWGDKYYYDVSNYDDIVAMTAGQMPSYLRKKYKTSDPLDQYLLERGLPYTSLLSDMYSEAWQERNEKQAKEQKEWSEKQAKKQSIYDSVYGDISAYAKGMHDLEQDMFKGTSFQDALASGKYDSLGDFYDASFGKVNEKDSEGEKYFKTKKTSLDPVYDRAYEAIMAGKAPDDEFFDQYKESSWKSYLKQKQKWNESSFQNAFDYQAIQNAGARLEGDQNLDLGRLRAASQEDMKTAGYKIDSAYTMLDPITITGKNGQTVVLNPVREDGTIIPKEELERIAARKMGEVGLFQSKKGADDDSVFIASFDNRKDAKAYAEELKEAAKVYYGTDRDDFQERLEQAYSKSAEEQGLPQGMTVETYKEPTELDNLNSDISSIRAEMEKINSMYRGRGTIPASAKVKLQELQSELDGKTGRRDEIMIANATETSTAGFDEGKFEQSKLAVDAAQAEYDATQQEKAALDAQIAEIDKQIERQNARRDRWGRLTKSAAEKIEELEAEKQRIYKEQYWTLNTREGKADFALKAAKAENGGLQTQYDILNADAISADTYAAVSQNPDFQALSSGLSDKVKVSGSEYTDEAKKIAKVIENGTTNNFNEFYTAQQMTEEEKQTFYYLCNTQGAEAGVDFVQSIMPTLNNRLYRDIDQKAFNDAEKDGLIYSLATLPMSVGAGLMEGVPTWASSTLYRLTGGKLGRDIIANDPREESIRYIKRIRGEVGENIGEANADETGKVTDWGKALQTGYAFAMSTSDNAARLIMFGGMPGGEVLSAASMYGNVFGDTTMEYLDKGASAEKAYLMGTLNAAAEAIGEAITFNEYLNVKNGARAAAAARAGGKNFDIGKYITHELIHTGTAEAWEEGVTEVLNFVFDRMVMGDDSELSQIYNNAMSKPGAKPGDGWWACLKKVAGDTMQSAAGGFLSGVLLGGFELGGGMYQQGMISGQEGNPIVNGAKIMTENARLAAECEMIYKDEIEANGTAVDSSTRVDTINAVNGLGLSKVQTDAIIKVYDMYAASPANVLSKRSEAILRNFQKILYDASQSRNLTDAQADVQMQKLYQKQADLWDSVLNYQQQAKEALAQGNLSAHNDARNKLLDAINKYKNYNTQSESQAQVVEIKQEQANEKTIENVKTAAEALAENIEEETVNQTRWMQAKLADMARGNGGEKLAALGERLRLVERAESVAEFADQYAMETGDQDAYQFWMDVKQALARGEDIGDLVSKHPEYVNELYESANTDDIASEMVRLAGERREAEANGDQEALRSIDAQFEGLQETYGDDIISAIVNGGALNGREESNGSGSEGAVEESSIYDNEGRRIDGGQAQRTNTGSVQEGETEYQSEIPGAPSGDQGEAGNSVGNWDERGAVENFRKAVSSWNEKKGLQIGDGQISLVVKLSPAQSRIVRSAMDYLGGEAPFLFKSTDSGIFAGVAIGGREYVQDTGDDAVVFTMGHERAHNSRAIQDAAANTLAALGQRGEEIFNKWAEKLADETGEPVYVNGKGRGAALNEFYSDMFGAFLYDLTTGKTVADSLGLDQSDLEEFYPAFLDQMASYAEEDMEETPGPVSKLNSIFRGGSNSQRSVYASVNLDAKKDENGVYTITKNGVPVDHVTTQDIKSTPLGAMINQAVERGHISEADRDIQTKFMTDLINMMLDNKDADLVWAWAGTQVFSAITNNSDPQYDNTVDFTTICRKTQALIDAMSARMVELQRGLSDEEILGLQDELARRGEAVPCPVCYVFSRWTGIGGVPNRIADYQIRYADEAVARKALEDHSDPDAETWITGVRLKDGYKPVPGDILFNLNKGGEFASEYPLTWKYRTTRGPALGKAMTPYAEMNVGDVVQGVRKKNKKTILKGSKSPFKVVGDDGTFGPAALNELLRSEKKMKAQNLMGGLRYQSTSDFRTDYALDYLLSFFDVQAIGGKIQTYTKVPEGADLLCAVGADVNLSVMPKGKGWVLNANGKEALDTSSVTGMDFKTAVDIKNKHDNAQLIMVGINDDHIRISLANSDIGFVIPYHASGAKAEYVTAMARNLGETVNPSEYTNYEDCQTDYINPNASEAQKAAYDLRMRILMQKAKTLSAADQTVLDSNPYLQDLWNRFYVKGVDEDCYGVTLPKAQAKMIMPYEYWDTSSTIDNADVNGERFKEYCESIGIIPRFSGKTVNKGKVYELDHGNFADLPGYWKVLIDRPMYNNDGSYHVQQRINVSGVTSGMLSEGGQPLFSSRSVVGNERINENRVAITKMDSVRDLTGEEFPNKNGDIIGEFKRYYNINQNDPIRLQYTNPELGPVSITNNSLRAEIRHGLTDIKVNAFAALPEVISNGKVIAYDLGGEHESDRYVIAAKIKIAQEPYYMGIMLNRSTVGDNHLYMHDAVVVPEKHKTAGDYDVPRIQEDTTLRTPGGSYITDIIKNALIVKEDQGNYSNRSVNGQAKSGSAQNYRIQQTQEAEDLYNAGTALSDYIRSDNFDPEVAAQLRGIMLRNGERVGGKLSDAEMAEISKDSQNWTKKMLLSLQSPVRVFKHMGRAWDNKTNEGVMRNFHASKKYSDTYYSYLSSQLQQENLYKANALSKINDIKASENDSVLAQLIGEHQITSAQAQNAVTDGKNILIPIGDGGAMVLDHKGRVRYIVDATEGFMYDDNVLKRLADQRREIEEIRKDNKPNKADRIKQVQTRGAAPKNITGAILEETKNGYRIVSGKDVLFEMKNTKSAYTDKAQKLADELTGIYQDMYGLVQESLIENGYAPIGKIEHYFPHFSQGQEGIGQAIEYLRQEDLPIGIAGLTETFSPGKPWARNLLSRIGDRTDYNAVRGFNNYLNSVSDVIYMTPVIQRLRQLENMLRNGGKEGETNEANTNLVTWLHEYTNGVANKKSALDRGMEAMFGRKVYQIIPKLSGLAGSAYVVGNVSSALTNFGAAFQASGEMSPKYIFKGLFDTAADNREFGDDIEDAIPFLTNRLTELDQIALNSGELAKTKGMKLLTWLMGAVDGFSSRMVARAKYYECMDRGMTQEEAIRETNKYCVELFAERSKGSKPTVFNSKTLSPFTQFQLEPWNQMWHWVDIHDRNLMREYERILKQNNGVMDGIDYGKMENQINRMGVAWRDIGQILGRLISMSIFGMLMRAVRGSDSHWNPLGFIKDAKRGYENEGVEGIWDAAVSQAENNAPGVSALTGSYQVPALSILKNMVDTLAGDWDENGDLIDNLTGAAKNIPEAALYAIPAGSQARKSWKGIQAYEAEGNYTPTGKLRYPIEQTPWNAIKSAVFGQSATAPEGYRWGKDVLSDKSTGYYQAAVEEGADPYDIYDFLLNDYNSKATQTKGTKLAALATSDLTDDEIDIMAQILDIKWDGDLETAAYDTLISEEESLEDNDKLKDTTKEKRQSAFDYYLDLLS